MALDRAHRDVETQADLGVGHVLAEGGEHLCLSGRQSLDPHRRHRTIMPERADARDLVWPVRAGSVVAPGSIRSGSVGDPDGRRGFEAHARAMHSFHTIEFLVAERRDALASDASWGRVARVARQVRRLPPQPPRNRR